MTSSLVGSEMCIRDRPAAEKCGRRLMCMRRSLGTLWRTCLTSPSARHWPVSYTHLTLPTICSV
eukprot:11676761-Prorocentrum_lima.AAC.1